VAHLGARRTNPVRRSAITERCRDLINGVSSYTKSRHSDEFSGDVNPAGPPTTTDKAAAAKLKVSLPIIPLIASYEMEMDTEAVVVNVWRRIKSLFLRKTEEPT